MRITIAQGAFYPVPPVRGGAVEKVWFALGREFARRGHEVVHVSRTFEGLPEKEIIDGVVHLRVRGYDTPASLVKLKLLDLLYSRRVLNVLPVSDILVTNTFWLPLLVRSSAHGQLYVHIARFPKGQLRFYQHAARLQTVSHSLRDAIVREVPRMEGRVISIPNPLSSGVDAPSDLPREKRLIFLGRIHPEKGLHLLLAALARLTAATQEAWSLIVIGSAAEKYGGGGEGYLRELQEQAARLKMKVTWTGPIFDAAKLNEHLLRASLFLYPSIADFGEALPLAPLEAMAMGCPPLVSNIACFRDYIVENSNGFIFDHHEKPVEALAAKLELLMNSPELLRAAVLKAREKAEEYRVEAVATRYLDDFASILAKSRAG